MANMMVRINPRVKLYVMKLEDDLSEDGGRTIFPETAAKAIMGAVRRKVDIMSWTVKSKILSATSPTTTTTTNGRPPADKASAKTTYDAKDIEMLEKAIDEAKMAQILMFCSASDDMAAGSLDSLPYRKAPDRIFRIGAALAHGQRDPHSEDTKRIDYFFPGNQVAEAWNPRRPAGGAVRYHDGSSVATALAAGLASLILYSTILTRSYHEKAQPPNLRDCNRCREFVDALKRHDGMRKAFDNINIQNEQWDDKKYLPVWGVFGDATKNISKSKGEAKLEELDRLVMDLCSRITNRVETGGGLRP